MVINVVEYITKRVILKEAWAQAMQSLGKSAVLSAGAIVTFNVWGFLLGIAAVWIYAAIRPRYGAGPNTAVRAGQAAWALAVFLANLSSYPMGLSPARLLVITAIVALVEIERAGRRFVALEAGVSRLFTRCIHFSGREGRVYGHRQLPKAGAAQTRA